MSLKDYSFYTDDYGIRTFAAPLTDSTNNDAKAAAAEGAGEALYIAREQTAGRGRLGRSFFSPGSGIYMSFLLRPLLKAEDVTRITTLAAVAVAEAIEAVAGKNAGIKWVNDVCIDGKKAAGILTEAGFAADGGVSWVVAGIGVNAYAPESGFPEELRSIATAVWPSDNGKKEALTRAIAERFMEDYRTFDFKDIHKRYRKRSFVPGKRIYVLKNGEKTPALALDIDAENHLLVRYADGREEALSTGEVSIRIHEENV